MDRMRYLMTLLLLCAAASAQTVWEEAPTPGSLRILLLGDFNGPYGSVTYPGLLHRVLEQAPAWKPDLVLMPGDLIAGQDRRLPDERFSEMWAGFDRHVASALRAAGLPYAPAIGNHDGSAMRGPGGFAFQRERDAAAAYWGQEMYGSNLAYVDRSDFPFHYSFAVRDLFVIVWDASNAVITEEQLAWVGVQLRSPSALAAEHRWLVGHLALTGIATGRDRRGEVLHHGDALARLLKRLGVDTYASGHQAAWYPGTLGGLELIMTGGIGARTLLEGGAPARSAVTLVDFDGGLVRYTAFDVSDGRIIRSEELPGSIGGVQRSERAAP